MPGPLPRKYPPRPKLARGRLLTPIQFHHHKLGYVDLPAGTTVLVRYHAHTCALLEPEEYRGVRVPRVLWRFEKPDAEILKGMAAG